MSLREEKARLRHAVRQRRAALADVERDRSSEAITAAVIAHPSYADAAVVAMYCDFREEVQTRALRHHALASGKRLALPRVEDGGTLTLRAATPEGSAEECLVESPLGIAEPPADALVVAPRDVELFILPGLAFDRQGGRLGYGRGHYDRLLTAAKPGSVWMGIAFECQWVEAVPLEPHDVRVHYVVTEVSTTQTSEP